MATGDPQQPLSQASASGIDWPKALAEHAPWLRAVVLARVGEPNAVAEVLQDVSSAAVEHGNRLRDATKIGPWLYRLAVIAALQYRRRQGRGRKLLERFATQTLPTEIDIREPDPLDWLIAKEQRTTVRTAINQLPRRDAEILLLKYSQTWTYRQIAEHLGLSASAVEARLHRARQKMRQALAAPDPSLTATAAK